MSKGKVTSIKDKDSVDAKDTRAEQMEAHAQVLVGAMSPFYRLLVDDENRSVIAEISEPGILRIATKETVIESHLIRMLGDRVTVSDLRNEVYPRWCSEMRQDSRLSMRYDQVKPFVFKSESLAAGWAWQRLAFDPVENATRPPELAELMQRTSAREAEVVELFIGSLFDYSSSRSQYLYLYGIGNDGKSMLKDAIQAMFSKQGYTTMDGDDLTGDKHATSDLEGKRLLVFPDMRKPSLPSSGIFKKITGDNTITVNPKGLARRNISLTAKVLILSNDAPQIDGGRADERRIISAHFKTFEGGIDQLFEAKFAAAAPAIAQYCYSKYCKWRAEFPSKALPQAEDALAEAISDSTAARAADLASELFLVEARQVTSANDVDYVIKAASAKEYAMLMQLRKWLKGQIQAGLVHKTSNAPRQYEGLGLKSAAKKYKSDFAD